jgi:hypothetical protein
MKIKIYFAFIVFLSYWILSCQDSPTEPDPQYVQIFLKYGFRNELNTFENTYQKDLVLDGTIKVKFWLSAEEQNKILEKANVINYFSMRDTFKLVSPDSTIVIISPDPGEQILRIKYQTNDKTTFWNYPAPENDEEFNELMQLRQYIIMIIESKVSYKLLPPARGGYI